MMQSVRDYPLLYAAIGVVAVICAALWFKAMQASRRRTARREVIIAELRRVNRLKHAFAAPTLQLLEDSDPEYLVEGLCCWIQTRLEAQEDMEAAYAALPEPQRLVYALGYVIQDGRERLSEFFRKNGQPLTGAAMQAAQLLLEPQAAALFQREFEAFDVEHEAVSVLADEIDALDKQFCALTEEMGALFYAKAKSYVLSNNGIFIE